jgi:hypothetical protein
MPEHVCTIGSIKVSLVGKKLRGWDATLGKTGGNVGVKWDLRSGRLACHGEGNK